MRAEHAATRESTPRRISDLPGPAALPLVGNALEIRGDQLLPKLEQWSRDYGGVYRFRIAWQEYVVISDPEMIMAVLKNRPECFKRRQRLEQTARELGAQGVFTANGATWKRQRPIVQRGLDPAHVQAFFPTLIRVTERLASRWRGAPGKAIDLQADLMRYTVDVTAGLAFGTDINTLEAHEEIIQSHLEKVFPMLFKRVLAPIPYWRYCKLAADRELDRHVAAIREAVQGFISEASRRLDRHPELRAQPSNLIETLIVARISEVTPLTDAEIAGNVVTMLLAGEDTTANTLAWTIWFLSHSPDSMQRARSEVQAVFGPIAARTRYEQLNSLRFLEACLQESMRLKPVAPIIVLEAARDVVVGDLALPAGASVMCLSRPAAIDAQRLTDPLAYRPERWLTDDGAMHMDASAKRVVIPFGAGPRVCPGRFLALAEMKMVLAMLLREFDFEVFATTEGGQPRERLAFTMSPVGLHIRLRARSSGARGDAG